MAEWKAQPGDGVLYTVRNGRETEYRLGLVKSATKSGRVKSLVNLDGRGGRIVGAGTQTFGVPVIRTLSPARRAELAAELGGVVKYRPQDWAELLAPYFK